MLSLKRRIFGAPPPFYPTASCGALLGYRELAIVPLLVVAGASLLLGRPYLLFAISFVVLLIVWEWAVRYFEVDDFIFPAPSGVATALLRGLFFYDAGGGDDPLKDPRLKPLNLVPSEKADLIAFLESLSGDSFDTDAYVWREDDYGYELIENWREVRN